MPSSEKLNSLCCELERDLRNQVMFDRMRRIPCKTRFLLHARDYKKGYLIAAALWVAFFCTLIAAVNA